MLKATIDESLSEESAAGQQRMRGDRKKRLSAFAKSTPGTSIGGDRSKQTMRRVSIQVKEEVSPASTFDGPSPDGILSAKALKEAVRCVLAEMADEGVLDLSSRRRSSSRGSATSDGSSYVSGSSDRSHRSRSRHRDHSRSSDGSSTSQSRSQSEESQTSSQSVHSRRGHGRSSSRGDRSSRHAKVQRRQTPCNSPSQTSDSDEGMTPIREEVENDNHSRAPRSRKKHAINKLTNDISKLLSNDHGVFRPTSRDLSQDNSRRSSSSSRRNRGASSQPISTAPGLGIWDDMGSTNDSGPTAKKQPKPAYQGKGGSSGKGSHQQAPWWHN